MFKNDNNQENQDNKDFEEETLAAPNQSTDQDADSAAGTDADGAPIGTTDEDVADVEEAGAAATETTDVSESDSDTADEGQDEDQDLDEGEDQGEDQDQDENETQDLDADNVSDIENPDNAEDSDSADNTDDTEATSAAGAVKERKHYSREDKLALKEDKKRDKRAKQRAKKKEKLDRQKQKNLQKPMKPKKHKTKNPNRRNMWLIIFTTLLVIGSVFMFTPLQEKINQGLDVQGGLSVVLKAQSTDGEAVTLEDMESSRAIIESRVNALGASEATVQVQGTDQILVQIPGLTDTETALATIGRTGSLEFARADSFTNEEDQTAITNGTYAQAETFTDNFGNTFQGTGQTYRSVEAGTYTPLITGANITRVTVDRASETGSDYAVNLTLDAEGTEAFAQATRDLAPTNGQIVIILDGQIQSAPAVQAEITTGEVSITGNYSIADAQSLKTVLESGSLPVSFTYEQSQVVGPTLGQDALQSGVIVALLGLALVMLYLIFFYHGLGLLTALAMVVFSILYLGLLAILSHFGLFSLSLAGIAGIVLTIGMAADSSILVLERFREEIRMGRSVLAAARSGVRHGILTSIDADLVTLVSALTLFFLASASVKGFGLTLALGIICDIIMMVILKAPLIRLLAPRAIAKHPGFWGIKDCERAGAVYDEYLTAEAQATTSEERRAALNRFNEALKSLKGRFLKRDINFMGARKALLTISAALLVGSFAVVAIKGVDFGIEFVGGTSINFHDTGEVAIEDMRTAFSDQDQADAVIQTTSTDGANGYLVRLTTTSAEEAASIANAVATSLNISQDSFEVTTIGSNWGAGVIQSSLIAFVVSLLLIIIYIAIRFEYKMGIMAVVALLHDLIIVVGVYALVGREVTPNTVAALLTILGYSLYDTVVVFHRIADNMKEAKIKCTFMSMANHSLNQVFVRTINTTTTSIVPVLAMLLFGGETLKDFAFAMVVGLLAGSYSSIAVATPLFAIWKTREPENAKLVKKYGTAIARFNFASVPMPAFAGGVEVDLPEQTAQTEAQRTKAKNAKTGGKKQPTQHYRYRRKK